MIKNIILNTKEQYQKAIDWLKDYFTLAEGIMELNTERNKYKTEDGSLEINSYNNQLKVCICATSRHEGSLIERKLKGFGEIKLEGVLN